MNTNPSPRKVASKVRQTTGGGSKTAGLHSAGPGTVRAGKKHPAKYNAGKLSAK